MMMILMKIMILIINILKIHNINCLEIFYLKEEEEDHLVLKIKPLKKEENKKWI